MNWLVRNCAEIGNITHLISGSSRRKRSAISTTKTQTCCSILVLKSLSLTTPSLVRLIWTRSHPGDGLHGTRRGASRSNRWYTVSAG
uniref:Uncharacterized protein n=1 Tax=Hyaloperonospora arabidopsidis (strain Emoy2) TaxID=559515 RepID=M4C6A6_HYAAE